MRPQEMCSVASRWLNRNLWTGNNRTICAEVWVKHLARPGSKTARVCGVLRKVFDAVSTEPAHCYRSYLRWLSREGDFDGLRDYGSESVCDYPEPHE